MGAVSIQSVQKTYNKMVVIENLSLTIEDGEFLVLVGPSGCGKSTLLRMIAGLEDISDGQISIAGRLINDLAPKDRDIAMVFQSYALYPHMTVEDNMSFSLRLKRVPKEERDAGVASAAGILGLAPYLKRLPRQLSGGQRQRVAMGRAIVRNPQVYLFDEPLSNLDAKLRVQMRSEIKLNHARLGTTTVYVTHDQIEAMTMADRIVVMNAGKIEQVGSPLELYDRPANLFVAGFIGSPAMNLLYGRGMPEGLKLEDGTVVPMTLSPDALGRDLVAGIRPEHLVIADSGLKAEILTVEPTGAETQIVTRMAGRDVFVSFRERLNLAPGDRLHLKPMGGTIQLFDAESGNRLGQ
ncbi:sn-glycerol-3-phosphate ABC transporter ATP-binding protein UgpC [Devosia rhodophyticola]|uniref:Sn-glycerol-3-phosphate ABC transporter ATP-binding protein UgpC n=1 Tax=Devosia rhodophyticola TaxID=3026423 RepID=A0ABY7Z229_9HYPH|nr:sn-glycerol-3-phosphate ABC transporter ATP-binding protein UgpC [Devosia rhodophyticola]WDR07519.1 sn-glycerol-3-phosphate ABC transporter ATP-binding protein UgpC [Devosia rhodophyticola]